jgi:hypothetical protein
MYGVIGVSVTRSTRDRPVIANRCKIGFLAETPKSVLHLLCDTSSVLHFLCDRHTPYECFESHRGHDKPC